MLCQMLTVGIFFVAFGLLASVKAREGADEQPFRENVPKFHLNFSAGKFDRNGPPVAPNIEVNFNHVKFTGRENFVKRFQRFDVTFLGIQLWDHIIVLHGHMRPSITSCRPNKRALTAIRLPIGRKVEVVQAEVFEFSPKNLMKKLFTITELDRIKIG